MPNTPAAAIFRPAMVLMSGRILGFILAFIMPIILVRIFTQQEFGTYKQLFLVFNTLLVIAQMGMAESLYYFLPEDSDNTGKYVFNAISILGVLGLLIAAGLWFFRYNVAALLNNMETAEYISYIGIFLLLMLMAVMLEIVMTNKKQHLLASATYASSDLFRALCFIIPVILYGNLYALLLGAVGFGIFRFGVLLYYLHNQCRSGFQVDSVLLRKHLAYAIPFGLAGMIEIIQVKYHLYAVSYYFDAATFALYAIGCLQIPLVDYVMTSTSNVMMINMREKVNDGLAPDVLFIWQDATRKLALIMIPMIGGLLLIAPELIVLLFTSAYAGSIPIFMLWTSGMLLTILLTDGVLRVFAETRFLIFQNLVRLVLIAVFIRWFLTSYGLFGAVLVTLFANIVARLIALARLRNIFDVSWSILLPWHSLGVIFAISVCAAIPALLIKYILDISNFPLLLITGLVYVLTYYFLLCWCGPMDQSEKKMLIQWTEMPLSRLFQFSRLSRLRA